MVHVVYLSVQYLQMNQVTSHQSQEGTTDQYDKAQKHTRTTQSTLCAVSTLGWVLEERALQELPNQGPRAPLLKPPEDHGGPLEIG